MALQAKGPEIREIALAAAFRDGQDVIGIPQGLSPPQTPILLSVNSRGASQFLQARELSPTVYSAIGADTTIALENPFPKVAGIGP